MFIYILKIYKFSTNSNSSLVTIEVGNGYPTFSYHFAGYKI